jgi:uncharacterized integral membrane protein
MWFRWVIIVILVIDAFVALQKASGVKYKYPSRKAELVTGLVYIVAIVGILVFIR